jgi:sulfur carrier protein
LVKLILRNKEYEVKPGMTLLSALQKINIVPESVIATRDGEMILDDEILRDGDIVKLIAVISGGAYYREERTMRRSDLLPDRETSSGGRPPNDRDEL